MVLFERKSPIFSAIIKEDDADDILNGGLEAGSADYDGGTNSGENNQAADTDANTGNPDNANDETKVDAKDSEDDEDKAGDDLNVDASLNGIDDDNSDDNQNNDSSSSTPSSSSSTDTSSDAEPVDKNTDMFSSLTAEEQAIKIREQKQQFLKLFLSCNDILEKVSNINTENTNIRIISKITKSLSSLKEYLNDYITYTFDQKSFIDNDIILDRFLLAFNTISSILDTIKIDDTDQNGSKKS